MKSYTVVQHNYSEFLGLIERQLEVRDIGFNYCRPFVGQDLPGSALQSDTLFLLGGSFTPLDIEACPWIPQERRLIDLFLKGKRPVVGIGFGALLVAEHAGALISTEPRHTAYWTTAHKTAAGEGDPLADAVHGARVLVMHDGSAKLPASIEPILVDDAGNWLAIRPQPLVYGMLFRPELKPGMIEDMIMEAGRDLPEHIGEILSTARDEWEDTQRTTDRVIVALVKALDLMTERYKAPMFRLVVE